MISGLQMDRLYDYNPGAHMGLHKTVQQYYTRRALQIMVTIPVLGILSHMPYAHL